MKKNSVLNMWRALGRSSTKTQNRRPRAQRRLFLERLEGRQLLTGPTTDYVADGPVVNDAWATASEIGLGAYGNTEQASEHDTNAPTVDLVINGGAAMTNSKPVNLALTASETLTEMRFAINSWAEEKYSAWEPFAPTKSLTLPGWQGKNYVFVQVRDQAGNVGSTYRSIVLDTVAPTVTAQINGGAPLTNSKTVNLSLVASDATSGMAEMRFAVNSQAEERFSAWEPFAATKTLTLSGWQGANFVFVQVRDRAGNIRVVWPSIVLDTVAPAVTAQINGGAAFTSSRTVNVTMAATDATSGVADMRFAVNSQAEERFSAWESFAPAKTLTLPNRQGANFVFIQVRDRAGNIRVVWPSIVLDTVAPTIAEAAHAASNPVTGTAAALAVLGADKSGEPKLTYTWAVTALPSGASAPAFSANGSNAAKNTVATFSRAGTYTFTVTITDPAGLSAKSSTTVVVSQTLTRIAVSPASASVAVGATQSFTARGLDQFGTALATQPTFQWTTIGGGTIGASSGVFKAPLVPGACTVTAASGAVTGTAHVTVKLGLKDAALDTLATTMFANDRQIDRGEMIQFLRTTGSDDNVVDANEFSDLNMLLAMDSPLNIPRYVKVLACDVVQGNPANARYQGQALGNLAAGSSAGQLNKLVDKWFLGADHPATSYAYQSFAGSLFVNNPAYTDMKQGALGDCYFIAAMGAIAKSSVAAVQNMFIANGDNTWTVRFYAGSTEDYLTVDRFLPINSDGTPCYQRVGGGNYTNAANELWLALAEKAYAQWNETGKTGRTPAVNSYDSIAWGSMSIVSSQVLGRSPRSYPGLLDSDKQYLIAGLDGGQAVTYGTKTSVAKGSGLTASHAYVVVGYDRARDTFQLHNPHGEKHPGPLTYIQLRENGVGFVIADPAAGPLSAGAMPAGPDGDVVPPILNPLAAAAMTLNAVPLAPAGVDGVLGSGAGQRAASGGVSANTGGLVASQHRPDAVEMWFAEFGAEQNTETALEDFYTVGDSSLPTLPLPADWLGVSPAVA